MNNSANVNIVQQIGGWGRLIIFSGVILSVPLFALLATGIYAIIVDRPSAEVGVLLTFVCLLVLWAIVWGLLWIISGFQPLSSRERDYEELLEENTRLKEQLANLKKVT